MAGDVGWAPFEAVGHWWLPESEENKVGGTLRFDPAEGSELSLIGSLRRHDEGGVATESNGVIKRVYTEDSMERSGTYPRIHGEAGGEAFTLDDCFRTRMVGLLGPASEETIHVGRVLKGAFFETDEAVVANSISFAIRYLAEWTCESGVSFDLIFNEPPDSAGRVPTVAIEGHDLPKRTTDLDDGLKLELVHHVVTNGPGNEKSISDYFAIRLRSGQPMSMADLIEVASDFQDLLSIATGRTASFDGIHLFPPGLNREFQGGKEIPMSVELLVPWFAQQGESTEKAPWRHEMFFAFPDLGGLDGVRTWMAAATRHRGALGRVMSTKYAQHSFISDSLLSRTAALQAFDTTCNGFAWSKFETRIKRCAALAGEPFTQLVGDVDAWTSAVRQYRDDVAHQLGRRSTQPASDQLFLAESVYWLFVICMLREAQAPAAAFDAMSKHQTLQWLGPRVRNAVAQYQIDPVAANPSSGQDSEGL